jgi:hypothetical protein
LCWWKLCVTLSINHTSHTFVLGGGLWARGENDPLPFSKEREGAKLCATAIRHSYCMLIGSVLAHIYNGYWNSLENRN